MASTIRPQFCVRQDQYINGAVAHAIRQQSSCKVEKAWRRAAQPRRLATVQLWQSNGMLSPTHCCCPGQGLATRHAAHGRVHACRHPWLPHSGQRWSLVLRSTRLCGTCSLKAAIQRVDLLRHFCTEAVSLFRGHTHVYDSNAHLLLRPISSLNQCAIKASSEQSSKA